MIYLDNGFDSFPKPEIRYRKMDEIYPFPRRETPERAGHPHGAPRPPRRVGRNPRIGSRRSVQRAPPAEVASPDATGSLTWRIRGSIEKRRPSRLTTVMETTLVLRSLKHLEKELSSISSVSAQRPRMETVDPRRRSRSQVTPQTRLVAVNHASNVTGWIQPSKPSGNAVKAKTPKTLFLVDAAQTAGMLPIDVQNNEDRPPGVHRP